MAGRKKAVVQVALNSQQEFDDFLAEEGLKVIDAYTEWCGPCKALKGELKRVKNDLSDDNLHMAVACIDKIPSLEQYGGTSKPTWLFYGGTTLLTVMKGVDSPKIIKTLQELLEQEHDCIDNNKPRIEFTGDAQDLSRAPSGRKASKVKRASSAKPSTETVQEAGAASASAVESAPKKAFAFGLIKPKAIQDGHGDAIFAKIAELGFKVPAQDEIMLSEDQAKAFYAEFEGKEFFEELIQVMTSGPCKPLVLSIDGEGDACLSQFQQALGPCDPDKAKEEAPESFRALFGSDGISCGVDSSDTLERSVHDISYFFPEFAMEHLPREKWLIVITPDAAAAKEDIMGALTSAGLEIAQVKDDTINQEEATAMLPDASEEFVANLISGVSTAVVLSHPRTKAILDTLCGPQEGELETIKESAPDSFAAKYKQDEVKVGVYMPRDMKTNKHCIGVLFAEEDKLEAVDEHLQGEPKPGVGEEGEEGKIDEDGDAKGDGEGEGAATGEAKDGEAVEGTEGQEEITESNDPVAESEAKPEKAEPKESDADAGEAKPEEGAGETKAEEAPTTE
eukprot:m.33632 g.33632  ORF g.33632 m.33632 type:complete len:565 (-) comp9652_c0_seq1:1444-3138(-)